MSRFFRMVCRRYKMTLPNKSQSGIVPVKTPRILITGGCGQLGGSLATAIRKSYDKDRIWIADDVDSPSADLYNTGRFIKADVTDLQSFRSIIQQHEIDWIFYFSTMLQTICNDKDVYGTACRNVKHAINVIQVASESRCRLFVPSSFGTFSCFVRSRINTGPNPKYLCAAPENYIRYYEGILRIAWRVLSPLIWLGFPMLATAWNHITDSASIWWNRWMFEGEFVNGVYYERSDEADNSSSSPGNDNLTTLYDETPDNDRENIITSFPNSVQTIGDSMDNVPGTDSLTSMSVGTFHDHDHENSITSCPTYVQTICCSILILTDIFAKRLFDNIASNRNDIYLMLISDHEIFYPVALSILNTRFLMVNKVIIHVGTEEISRHPFSIQFVTYSIINFLKLVSDLVPGARIQLSLPLYGNGAMRKYVNKLKSEISIFTAACVTVNAHENCIMDRPVTNDTLDPEDRSLDYLMVPELIAMIDGD